MKTCNIPHESECLASKHNKQSPFSFSIDRESTSSVISSVSRETGELMLTQSKEGEEVYQKEKEDSIITEFSKEGKENTNSIAKMTTFENSSNNDKEMKYRTNKESFPSVKYFKESDEVKEMIDQREEEKEETTGNERESEEIKTINNLVLVVVVEEEEEEERESMTQNLIKRRLKKVKKIKRKKNNIEIKEDINNINEYETAPFIYGGMNFMNSPEVMNCNEMNYQSPFIFDPMIMQMQQQQQQQWLQLTQMTQIMQMQMQMAPQMTFNYDNQIPFDIGNEEYNKNKNKNKDKNRKRTKEEKNNKTKNKKTRK